MVHISKVYTFSLYIIKMNMTNLHGHHQIAQDQRKQQQSEHDLLHNLTNCVQAKCAATAAAAVMAVSVISGWTRQVAAAGSNILVRETCAAAAASRHPGGAVAGRRGKGNC